MGRTTFSGSSTAGEIRMHPAGSFVYATNLGQSAPLVPSPTPVDVEFGAVV